MLVGMVELIRPWQNECQPLGAAWVAIEEALTPSGRPRRPISIANPPFRHCMDAIPSPILNIHSPGFALRLVSLDGTTENDENLYRNMRPPGGIGRRSGFKI